MLDFVEMEEYYPERTLLILTSRLTINDEEKMRIKKICVQNNINWFEFFKLALYHKTLALCWKNINMICGKISMPGYLKDIVHYMYLSTKKRNEKNSEQIKVLLEQCSKEGITCIPVKGAYLIDNLYKDNGIRHSADMDFLVRYEDIEALNEIMDRMGYMNGSYNAETRNVDPLPRSERIRWKLYMSNLPPYLKPSLDEMFPVYAMDFRYALDDSLNKEPIREIINQTIESGKTLPAHYLIHLCTHFYDEAKHSATIAMAKDLNMIKMCDIREYVLKNITDSDFELAIEFCQKYSLENALYYSLFCLSEIYADGYEKKVMDMLKIEDTNFLNTFGDSTLVDSGEFSTTFIERFFNCGSMKELTEEPKFFQKI